MSLSYKWQKKINNHKERTHPFLHETFRILWVIIGAVLCALGLELFLVPNGFLDGGITGISIILTHFLPLPLGVFLAIINLPFVIVSFVYLGYKASIRTTVGITALAVSTLLFHHLEPVTHEFALALGYGGLFVGVGVGIALRYGGALDGAEALSVVISQRTSFNIDQIILTFNLVVFVVAGIILSAESAMASFLLFYIVVTPIIRKVMEGGNEMKTAQIITSSCTEIIQEIHQTLNRRVLIHQGHRTTYGEQTADETNNVKVLMVIIARMEESLLTDLVEEIDDNAIIIFHDAASVHGGVFRKQLHH